MDKKREFIDEKLFISILNLIGGFILLANGLILLHSKIFNLIGSLILSLMVIGIYSYVLIYKLKNKKNEKNVKENIIE